MGDGDSDNDIPPGPDPMPPLPPIGPFLPGFPKVLTRVTDEGVMSILLTLAEYLECIKKNTEGVLSKLEGMPDGTTFSLFKVLVEDPVP